eukprot:CAMPEP_0196668272 /NCGR_PEP_ID=MMETSP1086-20130531/65533_1 /TAXON_ID=77921 /ORGANISM="Cyanoptyche  gloeocystis , Strain SAG4.97" /LENGTH=105 /DNA_ID=CAMNT_0042005669 /DNA_START=546 /DNA_END=864 /DNA_ORIENTATION=-
MTMRSFAEGTRGPVAWVEGVRALQVVSGFGSVLASECCPCLGRLNGVVAVGGGVTTWGFGAVDELGGYFSQGRIWVTQVSEAQIALIIARPWAHNVRAHYAGIAL